MVSLGFIFLQAVFTTWLMGLLRGLTGLVGDTTDVYR